MSKVFWNGFWRGFGRAQIVWLLLAAFCWLYAGATDDGLGHLLWTAGSIAYAWGAGEDEVHWHRDHIGPLS